MAGNRPDQMGFLQRRHQSSIFVGCLGLTARVQEWEGGEWTKHKPWLVLLTGPPQKSLASVQNGIFCFDFEIWHHINITGQACTELVNAEEKKRGNEYLNMIYGLLP